MSGPGGRVGWGAGRWGASPWGGAHALTMQLVAALATGENVVRLEFTRPVYYSGILDAGDASNPLSYPIAAVAGGVGLDGSRVHQVNAVAAVLSADPPAGGRQGCFVDVVTDRPMTPYPATYSVLVSGLRSITGQPLAPTTAQFLGAFKQVVTPDLAAPHPARDFANPQTLAALVDAATGAPAGTFSAALASFTVDESGDYAFDSGMLALKKRIYRRLVTTPGAFLHLGEGYGVGARREGKRLGSAAVIGRIAAKAEEQIALEPEVAQVRVRAFNDNAGSVRFAILVRTRAGGDAKFTALFPIR